ncbi:MAG: NAD(P)-dependent glycerol-1-phosphate dehydrogenase [Candidatus Heimdallarchaeum endolithica]|uniref:Glycerol-1-phosphate dehydrogenase [NAD(P)+] n=1 Tax=Candidatus Heimdallarchaeum endolithica TaxID=2876572 RepID=A0A9Y1FND5_9ARCH|nr:MAG: NAD(P)-dependent glycerol-1-phosphate dehydrogenase [Candidatus Heimdallarchaeum endolithica]
MTNVINEFKHVEMPQLLSLGKNMISELPQILETLKIGKNCVLITDKFLEDKFARQAKEILEISGVHVTLSTIDDSTLAEVDKQLTIIDETKSEFVIGMGGGKPIDIAKLSSFKLGLRFISVPTIASHDGIASSRASLKGVNERHSIAARPPIAVVADTEILDKSPYRFTAAGCGDILAKKTAIKDWLLAYRLKYEPISPTAISLSEMTVHSITENASIIRSKAEGYSRIVINALLSSSLAMCVAGSSRPGSGSEHMFSHALDEIAEKPALHGEQTALGSIIMSYLHEGEKGSQKQIDTMKIIGLPVTAKELGLKDEEVIKALEIAHKIRQRFTILGSDGLTHEAAINAALKTGVIR